MPVAVWLTTSVWYAFWTTEPVFAIWFALCLSWSTFFTPAGPCVTVAVWVPVCVAPSFWLIDWSTRALFVPPVCAIVQTCTAAADSCSARRSAPC